MVVAVEDRAGHGMDGMDGMDGEVRRYHIMGLGLDLEKGRECGGLGIGEREAEGVGEEEKGGHGRELAS